MVKKQEFLTFTDGTQFSATNPEALPLLTVKVQQPIGLRFEANFGTIINQSRATDSKLFLKWFALLRRWRIS